MTTTALPHTAPDRLAAALRTDGFALVRPQDVAHLAGCTLAELDALAPSWDRLELDHYLKDGGRYRRRRHTCFVQTGADVVQAPHRAHWQPVRTGAACRRAAR